MLQLNFHPFPVLKTHHLVLRQLEPGDAQAIFSLRTDERVNEFLDRPGAGSMDDALAFIDKINKGIENNEWIYWAIVPKNEQGLAGTICYWNIEKEKHKADIGYELLPGFQRRGIMQEAKSAVIEFGFSVLKLRIIDAWLHKDNQRSIKILEKNNFIRDFEAEEKAHKDEENRNIIIYSLINNLQTDEMIFREARITDIPEIQKVRNSVKENTLSDPALVTDKDVEDYITRRGKGWVCEMDNHIVGFAIADLQDNNIWALFIHPEYEGKGIGKRLHDEMLDWYFARTQSAVWLGTSPDTRAEQFYRNAGWKEVGIHRKGEIKFEMTAGEWKKGTVE